MFCAALIALAVASNARAQFAYTFDELPAATKVGQKLFVIDTEGNEIRGRLRGVSLDKLTLRVGDSARELTSDQISVIRTPSHDSVWNGAAIGAGVAGGLTVLLVDACDDTACSNPTVVSTMLVYGATIGALIDGLIVRPRDIYRADKRHVDVQPVVAPNARGASVAIRW